MCIHVYFIFVPTCDPCFCIHCCQALEDERRKASKGLREAKAAADADVARAKQALTNAEQQQHEAVRQCEAEGHRSSVKIAQAGRSLKAAKQETLDAQKQAKVSSLTGICKPSASRTVPTCQSEIS